MKKIVIFGASGHGKVILDILLESGREILGFLDEDMSKKGRKIHGHEVLGGWEVLKNAENVEIALGIGNNEIREKIFLNVEKRKFSVVSAVHPSAVISRDAVLGKGIVVMANAVVNPGVVTEEGVIINTGATVDHDCRIHKFCHIAPGVNISGNVQVGAYTWIGTGSAVIQNITIGKRVMIGAGASVIKDIPDGTTAVGVPAKVIKQYIP